MNYFGKWFAALLIIAAVFGQIGWYWLFGASALLAVIALVACWLEHANGGGRGDDDYDEY